MSDPYREQRDIEAGQLPFEKASQWAQEALRIAAGVPDPTLDFGGFDPGRDYRLVLLHLDGSDSTLPEVGAVVMDGAGTAVGRMGSSARHYVLGPIGLALVSNAVQMRAILNVGGIAARMMEIPSS
jgi:hypothetical protein